MIGELKARTAGLLWYAAGLPMAVVVAWHSGKFYWERSPQFSEKAQTDIQIISNEAGEPTAVIVPIELWREIAAERETAYLLKSETMKNRLLAAAQRRDGIWLDGVIEKLGL
jgi:antitoxin YefM